MHVDGRETEANFYCERRARTRCLPRRPSGRRVSFLILYLIIRVIMMMIPTYIRIVHAQRRELLHENSVKR